MVWMDMCILGADATNLILLKTLAKFVGITMHEDLVGFHTDELVRKATTSKIPSSS